MEMKYYNKLLKFNSLFDRKEIGNQIEVSVYLPSTSRQNDSEKHSPTVSEVLPSNLKRIASEINLISSTVAESVQQSSTKIKKNKRL